MNCHDLERLFIHGDLSATSPLPPEADTHLVICSRCRELVRALRMPGDEETRPSAALSQLAKDLAADLTPTRSLAPAGLYLLAFSGIFASIVAFGVYRGGTLALSAMSAVQSVSILCALAACGLLLAGSLVRQMVPGSRHRFRPEFLPAIVIVSLSLVVAVLFNFRHERHFWQSGLACLRMGLPLALLAFVPFWLLLRRGAILAPRATGAAAGLLSGLAGTSVLEIHCPNLSLSHILVWHVGVSVLGALGGLAAGAIAETLATRHRGQRPVTPEYS
jgi:hypothetical protein